jgi:hypothetical protein
MATKELTLGDRERFEVARALGQKRVEDPSAVVDACYDRASDAVRLLFRGGGSMTIPRRLIPGLAGQPASVLESVSVSPAGDALLWSSIDADAAAGVVPRRRLQRLGLMAQRADGRANGCRRSRREPPWPGSYSE